MDSKMLSSGKEILKIQSLLRDHSVDVVISNCVINLTTDKVKAFKEFTEF